MDMSIYQNLARRTQNPSLDKHQRLLHALHGLSAEVGEIHAIYQKVYQGHTLDTARVTDELGDLFWFAAELCDVLGVSMDDVAQENVEKLRRRYPEGFSEERSLNRP